MLLTITTTHQPATDLGFLLHKHPAKVQAVEISKGMAHIFYPEATPQRCTIALLLDIDPVGLVRGSGNDGPDGFTLEQYVNDRPYVASSLMSNALSKAFSSAMNGHCKDKPELVDVPLPLEVTLAVLPVSGSETLLQQLFQPLGYEIVAQQHLLDTKFPEWGMSRYFTVKLKNTCRLQDLLTHLYVLIPVLDNSKHYWVGEGEVQKLLDKGQGWLESHPAKDIIVRRYLKHRSGLTRKAMMALVPEEVFAEDEQEETEDTQPEEKIRLHDMRLQTVKQELLNSGASTVLDLGCGSGKLLQLLLPEKQFQSILGMDVSLRSIEIAKDRLHWDNLSPRYKERISIVQGALTYRDKRMLGFDAAALVEVIEHLDEPRLEALVKNVFGYAKPKTVVITTPNAEYNQLFDKMEAGQMRHSDHRFEWTRTQFKQWGNEVALQNGYEVTYKPMGEEHPEHGGPSQMAVFNLIKDGNA